MEALRKQRGSASSERPPGVPGGTKPPDPVAEGAPGPERTSLGRRRYPELVFMEPARDDREVYGDAWPLVEEWREIWKAGHRGTGKGLAWLHTEERVRTLEVAMLEEHGLTLPPEKMPLYGLDRRDQLLWRQKTLYDVRKSLAWAELRAGAHLWPLAELADVGGSLRVLWNRTEHFGRGRPETLPIGLMFGNNGVSFRLFPGIPAEKPGGFPSPNPGPAAWDRAPRSPSRHPGVQTGGIEHRALPKAAPEGHFAAATARSASAPRTPWSRCAPSHRPVPHLFPLVGWPLPALRDPRLATCQVQRRNGNAVQGGNHPKGSSSTLNKEVRKVWKHCGHTTLEKEATWKRN